MAHTEEKQINGITTTVTVFDSSAQEIDDAAAAVKKLAVTPEEINSTVNDFKAIAWHPTKIVTSPWKVIYPHTSVKLTSGFGSLSGVGTGAIIAGNPYIVVWNGANYECTAFEANGSVWLGNPSVAALGDDNGIPFAIEVLTSTYCSVLSSAGITETVTVRIDAAEVAHYEKMPEGFLPESVKSVIIRSSTPGSRKCFELTLDDTGTLKVMEV